MKDDIQPDIKDWTWVLDGPCPECGLDTRAVPREQVGALVRDNVRGWQKVLAADDARARPRPDRWSPLEYGCHVRDVFRLFDTRLSLMLTEDAPRFANWNQDETADEGRYGEQDPAVVAIDLAESGAIVADAFDAVRGDQWARRGERSDGAQFTVESFARYFIHDPVHHLWDVS